jgi:hypothetical protein
MFSPFDIDSLLKNGRTKEHNTPNFGDVTPRGIPA